MPNIKLQSSEGEIFFVDIQTAKCFGTIKTMLEDDSGDAITLPNVNSAILRKILQWADHHKNDPEPNKDDENKKQYSDDISSWDREFFKVDQDVLFELILAANYLGNQGLLEVACKTVANMIKDKSLDGIRTMSNIKNDVTDEEGKISRGKRMV